MRPATPLPIDASWQTPEKYVDSLLTFVSTSTLFRNLCGGVHILDFLTRKPDLYTWILPKDWRTWFDNVEVEDVLDLLLRENLAQFDEGSTDSGENIETDAKDKAEHCVDSRKWRGHPLPPPSLVDYIATIRRHSIRRDYESPRPREPLPRHVAVGMKPKKIHEVTEFAAFVDELSELVAPVFSEQQQQRSCLTVSESLAEVQNSFREPMVVDFGSGQNYLGRTLACPPYDKHVVAIEQWRHNVQGAKGMDVHAKLARKEKKMINKKEYKRSLLLKHERTRLGDSTLQTNESHAGHAFSKPQDDAGIVTPSAADGVSTKDLDHEADISQHREKEVDIDPDRRADRENAILPPQSHYHFERTRGCIEYIEKELANGDLSDILQPRSPQKTTQSPRPSPPSSLVVSIHSCGNLSHHALRSLTLNPDVRAVAIIGCCYNLLTERLGPATFKLPSLRSYHPRLEVTSSSYDPHGFPMSKTLENFEFELPVAETRDPVSTTNVDGSECRLGRGTGVRLNITARMMAVQAPHNWGPKDSEEFFTKHFYRALLQRILLDFGVVQMASEAFSSDIDVAGGTLSGKDASGTPLIIGTLRKSCFVSFPAYVRGAIEKLSADPVDGPRIRDKTKPLLDDPAIVQRYEQEYAYAKKQLSVIWSLMAFSANVVESTILVDRWLWLKEQTCVKDAWIQSVFDYRQSPRNMVVIGVKDGYT